jgi:hypothetical protein
MKLKKVDVILVLLVVIIIILAARRLTSNYNAGTKAADLLIRPVNIGKDVVLTDAKWTNVENYRPGDPAVAASGSTPAVKADTELSWYELNTKAWSIPNCWGFRKVLQVGGGGAVGYFLTDPSADMTKDCGVIDTTVLSDGVEYSIPDAFISQISVADPVQGTDCVWSLGAGSKWIVGSPAQHGGACSPAPPPVGFVNSTFFTTNITLPDTYYVFIGTNNYLGWGTTPGSYSQVSTGTIVFKILVQGKDGKFYGIRGDTNALITSDKIFGPWSIVKPVNSSLKWIIQMDNGTWIGIKTDNGVYTSQSASGPWTRQGTQTIAWGPVISSDGTLVATSVTGDIVTATDPAGTWTTYTGSLITGGSAVLTSVRRAYKLSNGKWLAFSSAGDGGGTNKLYWGDSPSGPWTADPNWRFQCDGGNCFIQGSVNSPIFAAFLDPDTNDLIVFGGKDSRDIAKANSLSLPVTYTGLSNGNSFTHGIGKVSPGKRLFLEKWM